MNRIALFFLLFVLATAVPIAQKFDYTIDDIILPNGPLERSKNCFNVSQDGKYILSETSENWIEIRAANRGIICVFLRNQPSFDFSYNKVARKLADFLKEPDICTMQKHV